MAEEPGQVGAFYDEQNAVRLMRRLRAEGKVVTVETKRVEGRQYYLVLVKGDRWPLPATALPLPKPAVPEQKPAPLLSKPADAQEREPALARQLGLGLYGDAMNLSGGATLLLNPHENIGLQAIAGSGKTTFYEARALGRFKALPWLWPYLGAGYIYVERDGIVIDKEVEYEDSGVTVFGGVELRFSRRASLFVEAKGSGIELFNDNIYNPSTLQEASSREGYSRATLGVGLVFYIF